MTEKERRLLRAKIDMIRVRYKNLIESAFSSFKKQESCADFHLRGMERALARIEYFKEEYRKEMEAMTKKLNP